MAETPEIVEAEINAEEPYNAADKKQVNTARKKHASKEKQRLFVVQALMENAPTRAYLHDLMETCNMFGNPVVPGDIESTYFNLGAQNVGKLILMDVMQFPELYVEMMKESRNRK